LEQACQGEDRRRKRRREREMDGSEWGRETEIVGVVGAQEQQ
jgi:hypothetical protein